MKRTYIHTKNVGRVLFNDVYERPSYFFKYQGIKAFISSSVEFCLNLVNNILVNSPGLYPFALWISFFGKTDFFVVKTIGKTDIIV